MKKQNILAIVLLITLLLSVFAVQAANGNFVAHLSGSNEVPANDSKATGQAIFKFSKDGESMHFKLIVANIDDVLASHIHCGQEGANGPVGVTLFVSSTDPVNVNGILNQATITAPDAGNRCGWRTLGDIRAAIEAGGAYVNVHTVGIPSGEVRGQVK